MKTKEGPAPDRAGPTNDRTATAKRHVRAHCTSPAVRFSPAEADEFAAAVDGSYVVVVRGPGGRSRRRVFLTVAAAQRAAERATERGQTVRIVLAELRPLYDVEAAG